MTVPVWPVLGTTVTLSSGYVITAAGATAAATEEIRSLLRGAKLLTWDPSAANPAPSPIPPDNSAGLGYVNLQSAGASTSLAYDTQTYLNGCISQLPATGGTIFVPRGEYAFSTTTTPLLLGDYVTVSGEGEASKFLRTNTTTLWFLNTAPGAKGVTIKGIRFEHQALVQFQTSVRAESAIDLTVEDCHFVCPVTPSLNNDPDQTLHAVLLYNCLGTKIVNNRVTGQQFKLGSSDGGRRTIVTGNHIEAANDFCVSYVCAYTGTRNVSDLLVADNIFTNGKKTGGVYFGGDSEYYPPGTCKRIMITDNLFSGVWPWTPGHSMILGHLGGQTEDVTVSGNTLIDEQSTVGLNTFGIYLKWIDDTASGKYQRRTIVQGNTVKRCDFGGIEMLVGPGSGTLIVENTVEDCRGIRVIAMGNVTGLTIKGNTTYGCRSTGIHIEARGGTISGLLVEGNTVVNTDVTGEASGIYLYANNHDIRGMVRANMVIGCYYGIKQVASGSGKLSIKYVDNDGSESALAFYAPGGLSGVGQGNRGGGWFTANPTSGSWEVGDYVANHTPVVGQPKGWTCTAGGTPGTWVSVGNL